MVLPNRQRTAIELLKLQGVSLREAARASGTSIGALKGRSLFNWRQLRIRDTPSPDRDTRVVVRFYGWPRLTSGALIAGGARAPDDNAVVASVMRVAASGVKGRHANTQTFLSLGGAMCHLDSR